MGVLHSLYKNGVFNGFYPLHESSSTDQEQPKNSQRTAKEQPKNTELPIAVPAVSYGT
jgi:hypothetical protein